MEKVTSKGMLKAIPHMLLQTPAVKSGFLCLQKRSPYRSSGEKQPHCQGLSCNDLMLYEQRLRLSCALSSEPIHRL